MRTAIILGGVLLLAAGTAAAQAPDWSQAKRVEIAMKNFKYMPERIILQHGQPYVLHFVNKAGGGHDFVAKRFFSAASVAPQDRAAVADGEIELDGGETADVHLIAPAPGSYAAHCSHFMHSTFGMKATIVVM